MSNRARFVGPIVVLLHGVGMDGSLWRYVVAALRNVAATPELALVIFDSTAAPGDVYAVYVEGRGSLPSPVGHGRGAGFAFRGGPPVVQTPQGQTRPSHVYTVT
jgi:pimeloyl-ACP methyl ester carboxylesterase